MISDLFEVYKYVILPNGQKISSPKNCVVCKAVKKDHFFSRRKCSICGHLYYDVSNTQDIGLQGKCWCKVLVLRKLINKREDYPEFWKKCLLDSLKNLEKIVGITCNDCKGKKACEDGGTNTQDIKDTTGFCEDIIL